MVPENSSISFQASSTWGPHAAKDSNEPGPLPTKENVTMSCGAGEMEGRQQLPRLMT